MPTRAKSTLVLLLASKLSDLWLEAAQASPTAEPNFTHWGCPQGFREEYNAIGGHVCRSFGASGKWSCPRGDIRLRVRPWCAATPALGFKAEIERFAGLLRRKTATFGVAGQIMCKGTTPELFAGHPGLHSEESVSDYHGMIARRQVTLCLNRLCCV